MVIIQYHILHQFLTAQVATVVDFLLTVKTKMVALLVTIGMDLSVYPSVKEILGAPARRTTTMAGTAEMAVSTEATIVEEVATIITEASTAVTMMDAEEVATEASTMDADEVATISETPPMQTYAQLVGDGTVLTTPALSD